MIENIICFIEKWSGRINLWAYKNKFKTQEDWSKAIENGRKRNVHTIKAQCLYCHAVL